MITEEIIPHMQSAVSLLEIQISEIRLCKDKVKTNLCSYETFNSSLTRMKLAAHQLQVAIASKNTLESFRQVQIFYGLLKMIRPTLFAVMGIEDEEKPSEYFN